jgi:hypothetical protein
VIVSISPANTSAIVGEAMLHAPLAIAAEVHFSASWLFPVNMLIGGSLV